MSQLNLIGSGPSSCDRQHRMMWYDATVRGTWMFALPPGAGGQRRRIEIFGLPRAAAQVTIDARHHCSVGARDHIADHETATMVFGVFSSPKSIDALDNILAR